MNRAGTQIPDFANVTVTPNSTNSADHDTCPGAESCPDPRYCTDCNPDHCAWMTGQTISAVLRLATSRTNTGDLVDAGDTLDLLDEIQVDCEEMNPEVVIHVVRGILDDARSHLRRAREDAPAKTPGDSRT